MEEKEITEKESKEEKELKAKEEKKSKPNKSNKAMVVLIVISLLIIAGCSYYLFTSYRMVKKYDVKSFKLQEYTVPTLNSALKSKRELVAASEKDGKITLKYNRKKMTLNDVFAYLGKLSSEGYTVVNLENYYIRSINEEKNIQIRIRVRENHLVIEYNIGIDKNEETKIDKEAKEKTFKIK